jgi:hypothetical protein
MSNPSWRPTQSVHPKWPIRENDWLLVDEDNDHHAQLWDTQEPDMLGSWRWRVWIDHKMTEGSAHSGAEARTTCEKLLAENSAINEFGEAKARR